MDTFLSVYRKTSTHGHFFIRKIIKFVRTDIQYIRKNKNLLYTDSS